MHFPLRTIVGFLPLLAFATTAFAHPANYDYDTFDLEIEESQFAKRADLDLQIDSGVGNPHLLVARQLQLRLPTLRKCPSPGGKKCRKRRRRKFRKFLVFVDSAEKEGSSTGWTGYTLMKNPPQPTDFTRAPQVEQCRKGRPGKRCRKRRRAFLVKFLENVSNAERAAGAGGVVAGAVGSVLGTNTSGGASNLPPAPLPY